MASIADASRAIRACRLSPVRLVERCIERIRAREAQIHAFAALDVESAFRAACEAEREIVVGHWRGPLHGIPVGVKDVIDVAGLPTRAQSRQLGSVCRAAHAPAVGRWHDGGALVLGKLTTHEFAFGAPSDDPTPAARNPWSPAHFAGGSSSGAAAGVASGMVLGALGTDTAGSVRSPAVLCGVTGFKPSRAAIDARGMVPLAPSLDTPGVIARSAEDCALLFHACAAPSSRADVPTDEDGLPRLDTNLRGVRLGVVRNFWRDDSVDSRVLDGALDAALNVFAELGCEISDVSLPPLQDWNAAGFAMLLSEAFALHERAMRERPALYGQAFFDAVSAGAVFDAADYVAAQAAVRALNSAFRETLTRCDLLVAPIQPGEAPLFDSLSAWGFLQRPSFGIPLNIADSPAIALCCGFGPQGLPLGLQIAGARGAEWRVLGAAHAYQRSTEWHRRMPRG